MGDNQIHKYDQMEEIGTGKRKNLIRLDGNEWMASSRGCFPTNTNREKRKIHINKKPADKQINLAVGHDQKVGAQVLRSKSNVWECTIHGSI